jgi:AcrR family transcriptional regulator
LRRLLDAGVEVFGSRGYHPARVDDIVKVAKTSHGTFYLYFANKEDLFRALALDVAEEGQRLADSLGPIEPTDDGYAALRDWLAGFADLHARFGPVMRAWTEADFDGGPLGGDVLDRCAAALSSRIRDIPAVAAAPDVAALSLVAMIERFNFYAASGQVVARRDDLLDTLAGVAHASLFGTREE